MRAQLLSSSSIYALPALTSGAGVSGLDVSGGSVSGLGVSGGGVSSSTGDGVSSVSGGSSGASVSGTGVGTLSMSGAGVSSSSLAGTVVGSGVGGGSPSPESSVGVGVGELSCAVAGAVRLPANNVAARTANRHRNRIARVSATQAGSRWGTRGGLRRVQTVAPHQHSESSCVVRRR